MVMEQRDGYQINLACECGDERHEWYADDVHPHWIVRPETWIMGGEGALDLGIVRGIPPGFTNNVDVFLDVVFEEFTGIWTPEAPDEEQ
jgi:hypothetical protein